MLRVLFTFTDILFFLRVQVIKSIYSNNNSQYPWDQELSAESTSGHYLQWKRRRACRNSPQVRRSSCMYPMAHTHALNPKIQSETLRKKKIYPERVWNSYTVMSDLQNYIQHKKVGYDSFSVQGFNSLHSKLPGNVSCKALKRELSGILCYRALTL